MKKYLLIVWGITLAGTFQASAQSYKWAGLIGGTLGEGALDMAIDGNGNVYLTGYFSGTADFDASTGTANLTAQGITDIFIAKYAANGNYLWVKRIGGASGDYGRHIALDSAGNIYVAGSFMSTVDFDPSASIANLVSAGGEDMFVARYDSAGQYVWAKRIGASEHDNIRSMASDAAGNLYLTGGFEGTIDFDPSGAAVNLTALDNGSGMRNDVFILKLDAAGNYAWAKALGSTGGDDGWAITLDATGNVYVAGRFSGTVNFGGSGSLQAIGYQDIFLAKYSSAGAFAWVINMGGSGTSAADVREKCLKVDKLGNAYIAGYLSGTVDFDPSAATSNLSSDGGTAGAGDLFMAKYDINGNYGWAANMGATGIELPASLVLDGFDNVYMTGIFEGTADFNPSQDTAKLVSIGVYDVFLAKYKPDGAYQWAIGFGGAQYDVSHCLAASGTDVWITGVCSPMVDFDPSANTASPSVSGQSDIFLARYCGNAPVLSAGIQGPISVCPNQAYTYSIDGDSLADAYTWILPNDWSGNSSTDSITVTAGSNGGKISVSAVNGCGTSVARKLNVALTITDTSVSITPGKLTANASGATYQWLNCRNGYAPINGATAQTYAADLDGDYAVAVTMNGCTDTSACYHAFPGEKHDAGSVKLYPNPGDGHFIIEQMPAVGDMFVEINNAIGQRIISQSHAIVGRLYMDIDVAEGVYTVTLTYRNGDRVVMKLVINR